MKPGEVVTALALGRGRRRVMMGGPRPAAANDCNYDRPTSGPYTCPPLNAQTCTAMYPQLMYQGGACIWPIGCCVCWWD